MAGVAGPNQTMEPEKVGIITGCIAGNYSIAVITSECLSRGLKSQNDR